MHHLHATGSGETGKQRMIERLGAMGVYGLPQWEDLRSYIDNMGTVMTAADLIICRAGASTIAELTAEGRASILVPSPNVTNNHQEKNARHLEAAGAAVVVTEDVCTGEQLYNQAVSLLRDRDRLSAMEAAAAKMGVRDASERIVDTILTLLKEKADK